MGFKHLSVILQKTLYTLIPLAYTFSIMSSLNLEQHVGDRFDLINADGDVLNTFYIELKKPPQRSMPGLFLYVESQSGGVGKINFRINRNGVIVAWAAGHSGPLVFQINP